MNIIDWSQYETVRFAVLVYSGKRPKWREVARPFSSLAAWQQYKLAPAPKMLLNFGMTMAEQDSKTGDALRAI